MCALPEFVKFTSLGISVLTRSYDKQITVKPVLSCHSKIDKTKILMQMLA